MKSENINYTVGTWIDTYDIPVSPTLRPEKKGNPWYGYTEDERKMGSHLHISFILTKIYLEKKSFCHFMENGYLAI